VRCDLEAFFPSSSPAYSIMQPIAKYNIHVI
jgi:hypothetical protein